MPSRGLWVFDPRFCFQAGVFRSFLGAERGWKRGEKRFGVSWNEAERLKSGQGETVQGARISRDGHAG
jgi:hypothetical protein